MKLCRRDVIMRRLIDAQKDSVTNIIGLFALSVGWTVTFVYSITNYIELSWRD